MRSYQTYSGVQILQILQISHRKKKANLMLTSLSSIVEFIDISSNFEKIMLIIIIKEYKSMMCNILNLVIELILTHLFQS